MSLFRNGVVLCYYLTYRRRIYDNKEKMASVTLQVESRQDALIAVQ
jgi:hypothetical protein